MSAALAKNLASRCNFVVSNKRDQNIHVRESNTAILNSKFNAMGFGFQILDCQWNLDSGIRSPEDSGFHISNFEPVPRKMVKFNAGFSPTLSMVFLSKNMQLQLTKYC